MTSCGSSTRDWNIGGAHQCEEEPVAGGFCQRKSFLRAVQQVGSERSPRRRAGRSGSTHERALVEAGKFSESLNAGVQHFASSLAEKLALEPMRLQQPPGGSCSSANAGAAAATPAPSVAAQVNHPQPNRLTEAGPALTKPARRATSAATLQSSVRRPAETLRRESKTGRRPLMTRRNRKKWN